MALRTIPGPQGDLSAIEYAPAGAAEDATAFVLLLPGTSIRPGPGAEKAAKYCFGPETDGIYRSLANELAGGHGIPTLQLCWRHFPADGGTTVEAVVDIATGIRYMRSRYGERCGFLLVGYSFGGAAVWAFLAECAAARPGGPCASLGGGGAARQSGLLGCVVVSGALKGPGDDLVNLHTALQHLESIHAPALVVHGSGDDNVSLSAAHKVFRQAASLKSLCVLMGADHDFREPHWRAAVAELCARWLVRVAAPRGISVASWARSVLLQHYGAAAALCEVAASFPAVQLAFDPPPQALDGQGPPPSYRAYELPSGWEAPAARLGRLGEQAQAAARLLMVERCGQHAKRQQRARERAELERRGPTSVAHARLVASRERKASAERAHQLLRQCAEKAAAVRDQSDLLQSCVRKAAAGGTRRSGAGPQSGGALQRCAQQALSGRSSPACISF